MATNAAMVAAKAARQPPAKLAAAIVEHLRQAPGIAAGECRRTRLRQSAASIPRCFARCCRTSCAPARPTATAPSATARASTSSTSPPIPPARCISAIAAAPWSATRWPTCWPRPATTSPRNTTSTTPARRSPRSPGRPTGATCRRSARRSTEADFSDEVPGGLQYRGDYLIPIGERLAEQYGTSLAQPGRRHRRAGSLARHRARLHRRGDDAGDPRGPASARRRPGRVQLRARADRQRRGGRRRSNGCSRKD